MGSVSHRTRPVKAVPEESDRGDARRERWREHREARRAEFVEATVRAIGKHGADVGMDDIAAEAGVSKPVLYRHFQDKSDLYLAVGQWGTELLMNRLAPELASEGSPNDRIRRLLNAYFGVIEQYPDVYRFVVRRTRPCSSWVISSCASVPGRAAVRNPSPTSTPLIAWMPIRAPASLESRRRSQCT